MFFEEPKRKPWGIQARLKADPIPSQEEIKLIADSLPRTDLPILFMILYLTGARITEIVKCKHLIKTKFKRKEDGDRCLKAGDGSYIIDSQEKIRWEYDGIIAKNIQLKEVKGKKVILFNIQNRKNPNMPRKDIPIVLGRNDIEDYFCQRILKYIENFHDKKPLFSFGRSRAEQLITKYTGFNCHFIRDIRATHMASLYNYTEEKLKLYFGWHTGNIASRYVKLDWKNLI